MKTKLKKRKAVYIMLPLEYGIDSCPCGKGDTQWSEYEDRLWCPRCEIDFEPQHWGVFDGPIPVEACELLGISFDRFRLSDKKILKFKTTGSKEWDASFHKK